jgi:hypothetical protein
VLREPSGVDMVGEVDHDAFGVDAEGCGDELGIEGVHQVGEAGAPEGPSPNEQIVRILDRLRPHTSRIAELATWLTADSGGAVLQVVRYFNETDQDQPDTTDTSDTPNIFGWHLDRNVLGFLTTVGAELDVDEYDMAPEGRARL